MKTLDIRSTIEAMFLFSLHHYGSYEMNEMTLGCQCGTPFQIPCFTSYLCSYIMLKL